MSKSTSPRADQEPLGAWLRGKYRLDAVLGSGGMAVVYAVTHRNGRRFAVKKLHPELTVRTDVRTRFLREGYIANAVGHPGAVAVLDDDVAEDGGAFLVMELLDGEGLDGILARHVDGVPALAALSVAHQLLSVLGAAHAKGIVHRDIKPANLFATRTGDVKVLDFGIARLHEPAVSAITNTGMTMGTPAFMSPEQAMGRPLDARADLFSVGATLFTLLSGRFVHKGDTGQELMVKAATQPAPPVASVAPHVPEVVCACVDRALAFRSEDRWQNAESMQAAIADAFKSVTGSEISGRPLAAIVTAAPTESRASAKTSPPPALDSPAAPGRAASPLQVSTTSLAPAEPLHADSNDTQRGGAASSHEGPDGGAASSIVTGDPVSSEKGGRAGTEPQLRQLPTKRISLVAGAAAFAALGALAGIALKVSGPQATPAADSAAASVSANSEGPSPPNAPPTATMVAPVASTLPPKSEPLDASGPPAVAPRTPATHAASRFAPSHGLDAATGRADGGNADPWATP